MRRLIRMLCVIGCLLTTPLFAAGAATEDNGLHIDVPVLLKDAKVVFNLDHPAFNGDEPIGLFFLHIMTQRFRADGTHASLVAIFHSDFGYMLLNDAAYDQARNWQHGNPYKDQIAALMRDGVQFEECGETMVLHHWRNEDLLPGAKVDTGANFRIIELVQQGYVQIQP